MTGLSVAPAIVPDVTPTGEPGIAAAVCAAPGCERPAVLAADRCRVHLADDFRDQGQVLPFADPELTGLFAAAVQIVRTALAGLPQDLVEAGAPAVAIDMYAGLRTRPLRPSARSARLSDMFPCPSSWLP